MTTNSSLVREENTLGQVEISIICITKSDPTGLATTLRSLVPLVESANGRVEVLVQNGGAKRDLDLIIRDFSWAKFNSEPDSGIYDAMNRGLRKSKGKAVWFLNGGDSSQIADWKTISALPYGEVIFYFDYFLIVSGSIKPRQCRPSWYIRHALPTSHQAIMYPGDAARANPYPTEFKVAGDYAFTAQLIKSGIQVRRVPIRLCIFQSGGFSTDNAKSIKPEAMEIQSTILELGAVSQLMSSILHTYSTRRHLKSFEKSEAK